MSNPTSGAPALPPAGWYPDPAGGASERWWAGTQWTDHLRSPQVVYSPPAGEPAQGYLPMGGFDNFTGQQRPSVSARTASANTTPIWLIAFFPLISVVAQLVGAAVLPATDQRTVSAAVQGVCALFLIAMVIWDGVQLRGRHLPAASAFWLLLTIIAYLIARRVVLKRAGVISNGPGNVFAGFYIAFILLAIAAGVVVGILGSR